MDSRYVDAAAARAASELGVPQALALRTYTARLLGADPALVLHGGGNTSVKARAKTLLGETLDVIHVKGSGWDLATIEPKGHPAVRLAPLLALRALDAMTDEDMVNALRANLLDAAAPTPSVETLLHAYLPARYVDHTHADAVLALADQPDAERICAEVYGRALVFVPYVMPGFALAKRCAEAYERAKREGREPWVIVLEKHGVFTFGETAKESYERMIEAVTVAERAIADRQHTASVALPYPNPAREAILLPRLRGALARAAGEPKERGPIVVVRANERALGFLERSDAFELSQIGCATPDHVLRTKPVPMFVRAPKLTDPRALDAQLDEAIASFSRAYDAYFAEMSAKKKVERKKLDPWPRIVLVPQVGICAVGKTRADAEIAADVYEHTIDVILCASDVGRYRPVERDDLFDLEYWSLEQAKLKPVAEAPLAGRIALITGAASGIGRATADRFHELGAHVALVDKEAESGQRSGVSGPPLAVPQAGPGAPDRNARKLTIIGDVTSWEDVQAAISATVRTFGGLDLVVSNAGNAPEGRLDTQEGEDALRRSLELNLLAHNHVARAASEVMIAQGRGGALLFNASKSAFNPGPGFGPYAVAKSALVALMRQYAVDLGKFGVRANAVNADRVRTRLFEGGVLESRASARGVSVDDYFRSNLLEREVTARDVADAFAFLAGARSTTGCVVTVDGGNAAAFPR
jgi:rhamnose utilization protein RhaD (predicted bifunctional aldolase and dehydrogenase)/NAD(P)-dependent dehydrogenase (short-subunit alcohol dehydrogenase family)